MPRAPGASSSATPVERQHDTRPAAGLGVAGQDGSGLTVRPAVEDLAGRVDVLRTPVGLLEVRADHVCHCDGVGSAHNNRGAGRCSRSALVAASLPVTGPTSWLVWEPSAAKLPRDPQVTWDRDQVATAHGLVGGSGAQQRHPAARSVGCAGSTPWRPSTATTATWCG